MSVERSSISGRLTRRQKFEFLLQPDFNWSRSLSERVRGMRDSALSIVWKKRREQKLQEIEAREACLWLRSAGFPQYVQMFRNNQCPIDVHIVEHDHIFLDPNSLELLFRRISRLNKLSTVKQDVPCHLQPVDSDDEEQCALSENWKYKTSMRRWIRRAADGTSDEIIFCGDDCMAISENGHSAAGGNCRNSRSDGHLNCDKSAADAASSTDCIIESQRRCSLMLSSGRCGSESPVAVGSPVSGTDSAGVDNEKISRGKGRRGFLKGLDSLRGRKVSSRRNNRFGSSSSRERPHITAPVILDSAEFHTMISQLGCTTIHTESNKDPLRNVLADVVPSLEPVSNSAMNSTLTTEAEIHCELVSDGCACDVATYSDLLNSNLNPTTPCSDCRQELSGAKTDDPLQNSGLGNGREPVNSRRSKEPGVPARPDGRWTVDLDLPFDPFENNSESPEQCSSMKDYYSDFFLSSIDKEPLLNFHDNGLRSNGSNQMELDQILEELYRDINILTETLETVEGIENSEDAEPGVDGTNIHGVGDHIKLSFNSNADRLVSVGTSMTVPATECNVLEASIEPRERRDSGVGLSLTRTNKRRARPQWDGFIETHHVTTDGDGSVPICQLSARQLMVLHRLSIIKMTSLMEKYSPLHQNGSQWRAPAKFVAESDDESSSPRMVFGVPILTILQRTGHPLPQCMLYAMQCLHRAAAEAVGIFRKSGVRSRIQKLRDDIEADPDTCEDFDSLQSYDVADVLKLYFRELPECLLTMRLSEALICIFTHVPADQRLDALRAAVLLLPDENRQVLKCLLLFLRDMADYADQNQMNASNLAICFAPSLFHFEGRPCGSGNQASSPKRDKSTGTLDHKELLEQKAAHECLMTMITNVDALFMVYSDMMMQCRRLQPDDDDIIRFEDAKPDTLPGSPNSSGQTAAGLSRAQLCLQEILLESEESVQGWSTPMFLGDASVSFKRSADDSPLRLWKSSVDCDATPSDVLTRVIAERHLWDPDLIQWRIVDSLGTGADVFHYTVNSMVPSPPTDYCELRLWKTDLPKGVCAVVAFSVEHPEAKSPTATRAVTFASHYLIEPYGHAASHLTYISRVDMRGQSPEWYRKAYGYVCAATVSKIRDSFRTTTTMPSLQNTPDTNIWIPKA